METNRAVVLRVACLPLALLAVVLAGGCTAVPSAAASESPADPSGRAATSAADGGAPTAASARCRTDADCALSRRSPGNCCQSLCEPRPLSRAEASAEEARCRGHEEPCPGPACAPEHVASQPACVAGRCTVRGSAAAEAR